MSAQKPFHTSGIKCLLFLVALLLVASASQAQTKQLSGWLEDLTYLQDTSDSHLDLEKAAVEHIFAGVAFWLKLHPRATVEMPAVPPKPWDVEQTRKVVTSLRETIESILQQEAGRPFELGIMEVSVTAELSPLSPRTDSIDHHEIRTLYAPTVTESIQYIPGVTIDHKTARGQSGIMIRGFDSRQIGLYLDGVPIYVPYDGFVDISRFLTSDIGGIEVAKGYSSPLLGPNGLGGAVNMVTRQPEKKLEGDAGIGTGSGEKLESWLHLGSRWRRFFLRGGMDWLETDYSPISGKFELNPQQPSYHRVNSAQRDVRYNARIGWTPREEDQYVLSYVNQKADYGAPPYAGTDIANNKPKYWQWPTWNKDSYYINTNTGLSETSAIKFRAFYDHYPNRVLGFTDMTYSVLSSATPYDDHAEGLSSEFTSRFFPRHTLSASFFIKDDTHRESSTSYTNGIGLSQPWRRHSDQMVSIGVQDAITLSSRMRATVGLSADHLNAKHAEDLLTTVTGKKPNVVTTYSVVPFTCPSSPDNTSFSGCLSHEWDFNPLASLSYTVSESGTLFLTFAKKSHFPTLKDRYSYKNGKAIPNPTLKPEHTRNWDLGYSQAFGKTVMQINLFRSDVYDAIQNATIPAEFEGQCPGLSGAVCEQSVNVSDEVHQGVEFTLRSTPFSRLTVDANYMFLNRTITGPSNMSGVYPTGSPKHKVIGTVGVNLPHRALAIATARYESGTFDTNDFGSPVPASKFATADLSFVLPIFAGTSLQTGVRNLFDRNYYYKEGFPEAGRTWHLSARYSF
jgi:iron complex outermembrane receptor protein